MILSTFLFLIKFTFKGLVLNALLLLQLLVKYPLQFTIVLLLILITYKFFIFLGFNQKRSIKLSSPYLNGRYYLQQLSEEIPDPHNFYHLEPGILSRPMYCFVCDGNVNGWNSEGLCCDICGYTAHARCVRGSSNTSCKTISTFNSFDEALDYAQHTTTTTTTTRTVMAKYGSPPSTYSYHQNSKSSLNSTQTTTSSIKSPLIQSSIAPLSLSLPLPLTERTGIISPVARRTRLASNSRTRKPTQVNITPILQAHPDGLDRSAQYPTPVSTFSTSITPPPPPSPSPSPPPTTTTIATTLEVKKSRGISRTRRGKPDHQEPYSAGDDEEVESLMEMRPKSRNQTATRNNTNTSSLSPFTTNSPSALSLSFPPPPPSAFQHTHQPSQFFPSTTGEFPFTHHWVHGNHSSISDICFLCGSAVGSVFYRYGVHCLWCGLHAHEDCLKQSTQNIHGSRHDDDDYYGKCFVENNDNSNNTHNNNNSNNTHNNDNSNNDENRDITDIHCCNLGVLAKAIIPPHCIYPGGGYTVPLARYEIATKYTHEAIAQERRSRGEVTTPPSSFNTNPKLDFPQLFQFTLPERCYPLLVIINRKSGGNGGVEKMHDFVECLNPIQVWDLSTHPAELPLTLFKQSGYPFRVLVCGGDGTISSVLHSIDHVFGITPGTSELAYRGGGEHITVGGHTLTSFTPSQFSLGRQTKEQQHHHHHSPPPPCAVLPLGTGNDLAQVLGWGGTNPTSNPRQTLSTIINGRLAVLDRWDVKVIPNPLPPHDLGPLPPPPIKWAIGDVICQLIQPLADWLKPVFPIFMPVPSRHCDDTTGIMNNYIGFGLDAVIAHQFADLRSSYPRYFTSQMGNKLIYTRVGFGQWIYPVIRNGLKQAPYTIKVFVDGVELENINHLQGICCLGIKSFGGGICFWGDRHNDENTAETDPTSGGKFQPPALDDGMFELIGFESSMHMALIQTGQALPHRLAQGRKLEVEIMGKLPLQIDGESWGLRENCRVVVELRTQSLMIVPLHSGPTQSQHDNLGYSPLSHEINVTDMLHDVMQSGVRHGFISQSQSSQLMIDFTKKFTKATPSSHFYPPSHDLGY